MIKHHDQGTLEKKLVVSFWFRKDKSPDSREQAGELKAQVLNWKPKAEKETFNSQIPGQVMHFLQPGCTS